MKLTHLSRLIRLAVLRTLMRTAGFVLRRMLPPGLRPVATPAAARNAHNGRVIDGEYRRIDPRHNNSW